MIIVVRPNSTQQQIDHILERIQELGYRPHISRGERRTIIGVIGDENKLQAEPLSAIPGVEQVLPILKAFSQMEVKHGSLNVTAVDLIRRRIAFDQTDVRTLDWPTLKASATSARPRPTPRNR